MPTLPPIRCPGCGKTLGPIKNTTIPPANKYDECLRRCPKCGIGVTNAKNPAKVKYLYADQPKQVPPAAPKDVPPAKPADTPPAKP